MPFTGPAWYKEFYRYTGSALSTCLQQLAGAVGKDRMKVKGVTHFSLLSRIRGGRPCCHVSSIGASHMLLPGMKGRSGDVDWISRQGTDMLLVSLC